MINGNDKKESLKVYIKSFNETATQVLDTIIQEKNQEFIDKQNEGVLDYWFWALKWVWGSLWSAVKAVPELLIKLFDSEFRGQMWEAFDKANLYIYDTMTSEEDWEWVEKMKNDLIMSVSLYIEKIDKAEWAEKSELIWAMPWAIIWMCFWVWVVWKVAWVALKGAWTVVKAWANAVVKVWWKMTQWTRFEWSWAAIAWWVAKWVDVAKSVGEKVVNIAWAWKDKAVNFKNAASDTKISDKSMNNFVKIAKQKEKTLNKKLNKNNTKANPETKTIPKKKADPKLKFKNEKNHWKVK